MQAKINECSFIFIFTALQEDTIRNKKIEVVMFSELTTCLVKNATRKLLDKRTNSANCS